MDDQTPDDMGQSLRDALEQYRAALREIEGTEGTESMREELENAIVECEAALQMLSDNDGAEQPVHDEQGQEGDEEDVDEDETPAAKRRRVEESGPGPSGATPVYPTILRNLPLEPDFAALATKYPTLAPFLIHDPRGKARPTVDFKNSDGSRELTRVLLKEFFGVNWSVPVGQLVPPVPNRANYIKWLAQLVSLTPLSGSKVTGVDIGCGANLIYPLLGASMFGWSFVGVDVTDVALDSARGIVAQNPQLQDKITIRAVKPQPGISGGALEGDTTSAVPVDKGGVLLPAFEADQGSDSVYAFTMCNPPFFSSIDKAGLNPNTNHEGTAEEMVCPGGEEAFVMRMVEDSVALKDRVYWFSTMVGKKSTLKQTRYQLQQRGVNAIRTTELQQGKTVRWCIAWSYLLPREVAMQALPAIPDYTARAEGGVNQGHGAAIASPAAAHQPPAATAAALLGSHGVSVKQVVPRSTASIMHREKGARADTVFAAFLGRLKGFGCELQTPTAGVATNFAGDVTCAAHDSEFGLTPTQIKVSMLQQDKLTFIFELKVVPAQKGDAKHQKRLGWLSASLSAQQNKL